MDFSNVNLLLREQLKLFIMRFYHPVYDLTDTYRRYCVYKRHQFYDTKVWQLIISVMAAIIASLLTNLIMVKV